VIEAEVTIDQSQQHDGGDQHQHDGIELQAATA
jgi:hypothetical protein